MLGEENYYYETDLIKEPPDIYDLFNFYNGIFFDFKLSSSIIKWSKRMTLCAGTCAYKVYQYIIGIRISHYYFI